MTGADQKQGGQGGGQASANAGVTEQQAAATPEIKGL
jgi:hypothetical protein